MKRVSVTPIGKVIDAYFKENGMQDKILEQRLLENLKDILGQFIYNYVTSVYIKDRVLYIKVSNSILRGEIAMTKQSLIERLNASVSPDKMVIRDINV
ncbi:MAG: DUF721 domain-containing protein [Paludibacteraceae bacterium]|nr:DUF721 domain-containing protein [Paludibacteraceae bacterium]